MSGIVHLLTCGSVDDGKSTLIGRLLWDASDLYEDQRESVRRSGRKAADSDLPDFSMLLDGLVAEREQGITIDIAWKYFDTETRRFVIIDSPGHEQYTRNMASGASHADVAILLVDARAGVKTHTKSHASILDLVGVKRVVLAVNKMDLVHWSEEVFRKIEADFRTLCRKFNFLDATAIPLSADAAEHPLALRPGLEARWQPLQDARVFVATDVAPNSDFRGLDQWNLRGGLLGAVVVMRRVIPEFSLVNEASLGLRDHDRGSTFVQSRLAAGVGLAIWAGQAARVVLGASDTLYAAAPFPLRNVFTAWLRVDLLLGQALRDYGPLDLSFRPAREHRLWTGAGGTR